MPRHKKSKSKKVTRKQVADPRGGTGAMTDAQFAQFLASARNNPTTTVFLDKYGGTPLEGFGTAANMGAVDPRGGTGEMTDAEFSQFLASTRNNPAPTGVMDKYITKEQGGSKKKKAKTAKRKMSGGYGTKRKRAAGTKTKDSKGGFGVQGMGSGRQ